MSNLFGNLNGGAGKILMEGIDTKDYPFKPLKDFIGRSINVKGFFFTDGKYGKQVVIVGDGVLVNMPARALEQFEELKANPEMVSGVLAGKLALTDIKTIDSKNGTTTAYTLTEV